MRTVAVLIAALSVFAALPLVEAADECTTNTAQARACQRIDATRPSTPPPAPGVPPTPYWGTYYLWLGIGNCVQDPIRNTCRGTPASPGSGVPLPTSGAVGAGVFGILYQESNTLTGLQREQLSGGVLRPADRMVLV